MHQEKTDLCSEKTLNAISGDSREVLVVKLEETAKRPSKPGKENNCRSI